METVFFFETLISAYKSTWRYNPEDVDNFTAVCTSNLVPALFKYFPTSLNVISRTIPSGLNSPDAAVLLTRLATSIQRQTLTLTNVEVYWSSVAMCLQASVYPQTVKRNLISLFIWTVAVRSLERMFRFVSSTQCRERVLEASGHLRNM
jgi:hypothetical protein